MSAIEITPELLADIEQKAKRASSERWEIDGLDVVLFTDCNSDNAGDMEMCQVASCEMEWDAEHIAAANPAVMLAMSKEIRRLWAAQCWAIVTIETGVIDGPYATKEAAENKRLAELCDDPDEPMYRVEPWKGGA